MDYPIIKLPFKIEEIINDPINAIKKPIEPILPIKPSPKEINQNASTLFGVLIFLSIFLIIGTIATNSDEIINIISITGLILIVSIIGIAMSNSNRKSKEIKNRKQLLQYHENHSEYRKQHIEYLSDVVQYNDLIASLDTSENIECFKFACIKNELINQTVKIIDYKNPKKGISEESFEKYLRKYFHDNILVNRALSMEGFDSDSFYSPDFLFYDPITNLKIDIEVDEPYTLDSGEPIHYLFSDDKRDKFILSAGTLIIRFAEKQILENPCGCCKSIAEIINSIIPNYIDLILFENINDLEKIEQPSFFEAKKMEKEDFRNTYLKRKAATNIL